MSIRDLVKESKHTIHYYIGGGLCTGTVNDDYLAESEKSNICTVYGYSKSFKAQVYIHPVDGRFFIPI